MSAKLWVSLVFTSALIIHFVSAAADDSEAKSLPQSLPCVVHGFASKCRAVVDIVMTSTDLASVLLASSIF